MVQLLASTPTPPPGYWAGFSACTELWAATAVLLLAPAQIAWTWRGWDYMSYSPLSAWIAVPRVIAHSFIKLFPNVLPGGLWLPPVTRPACVPYYVPFFIIRWVKLGLLCPAKQGKPWEFITRNLISREKNRGLCVEACWTTHSCNSFPTLSTSGTVTHFASCSLKAGTFICWAGLGWSTANLPGDQLWLPRFVCLLTGQ